MSEGNYQNIGDPAKLLLLISILAKDRAISNNSKAFIKEMVLRRDSKLNRLFLSFESNASSDSQFLEDLHNMVMEESMMLYNEIFADTTLEVGKTLSKDERDRKDLHEEKSLIYGEVEYQSFYRVLRKINAQPGNYSFIIRSICISRFTTKYNINNRTNLLRPRQRHWQGSLRRPPYSRLRSLHRH